MMEGFPFYLLLYTIRTRNRGLRRSLFFSPSEYLAFQAEVDLDYDQDDIERTQMIAYANDLAIVTDVQRAEYMHQLQPSAFCAFTGLVMHYAKVVSILIGPTPQNTNKNLSLVH
jgi:hypothetical protein